MSKPAARHAFVIGALLVAACSATPEPPAVHAESSIVVRGFVLTGVGKPLAGASVSAVRERPNQILPQRLDGARAVAVSPEGMFRVDRPVGVAVGVVDAVDDRRIGAATGEPQRRA